MEEWIIYGIIASFAWGVYIFLIKITTSKEYYDIPHSIAFCAMSFGILSVASIIFFSIKSSNSSISLIGTYISFTSGLIWGIGMVYVIKALSIPYTPISKLTPLYNTNTLVATVFGIILLKEIHENTFIIIFGAILVVFGGFLVIKQSEISEHDQSRFRNNISSLNFKVGKNLIKKWILFGIIASLAWGMYALLLKLAVSPEYYNNAPYISFLSMSMGIQMISLLVIVRNKDMIRFFKVKLIIPFVSGVIWAIGMFAVIFALYNLQADVSRLVPLYNTNTIVATLLGIIFLHEVPNQKLIVITGALLIIIGGSIVSIF